MGNTRSISAQKPRLSEKNKFLFNQIDKNEEDNFPKIPLSTKTTETMNKNIKINEEDFRTIKKPSGLKEINETIKNCSYIAEYSYLANPNLFFLQISSLSCNPEKINTKKEIQYYLDFPLLFGKTVKSQNLIKTPRNSKTLKDNNTSDKSNEEPNSDLKRNSSSIVKDGTSKLHNNRDLSSPKEDGSTPHFDKKSDLSNSQTKLEITQTIETEKNIKDFQLKLEAKTNNPKENQTSLKEKLTHILKSNLNKSINSDNSLKISGILDTVDDEPHHIHLNLEDFLKNNNNEKTNNKNVLSKANLDLLNNMNNRTSNEKRNIPKNNLITKNKINSNANNKKMNNITTRNAIGKSIRNEDIYENSQIKNKFQNSNSLLMILNENNQKTKKNDKENEGNLKKYVNLNKDPKRINFINENSLKMRKMK